MRAIAFVNSALPELSRDKFDRNNAIAVFLMGALPTVGGSAISVLLDAFFVWAIICVALRRFPLQLTPTDKIVGWSFTAFVLLLALTAVIGNNPIAGLVKTLTFIPFLAIWLMIPRLRASQGIDYLTIFASGAAVGAIGGMVFGLVQEYAFNLRAQGGAGNPGVYAIMSLALASISALNITSSVPWRRWLAFAGLVAGMVSTIIALSRGVWLAAIPMIVVIAVYAPRSWRLFSRKVLILAAVAACLVVTVLAGHFMEASYSDTMWSYQTLSEGHFTSSPGQRIRMWIAGVEAFKDSPWWGYGIQNRMDVVIGHYPAGSPDIIQYTHAHNGLLSTAIDGGLLLLIALIAVLGAPILVAARSYTDAHRRKRLFLALSLTFVYVLCGQTQIMFGHDIMNSFYIFTVILICASIPSNRDISAIKP